MTRGKKQIGALAAGAATLSLVGYTLGSQAGDGLATAAGDGRGGDTRLGPRGAGLQDLADRLGVERSELRQALRDIRPERPSFEELRDEFTQGLADKLGVEQDQVEQALEELREEHEAEHEQRRAEFAQQLADRLGIDVEKVEEELGEGPPHRPGGPGGPPGPGPGGPFGGGIR